MFQTVTFDCYGTLIDWEGGFQATAQSILAGRLSPLPLEELWREWRQIQTLKAQGPYKPYHKIIVESFEEAIHRLDLPVQPRDGERLALQFPTWKAFPDVLPALLQLKNKVPFFLISNTDDEILSNSILKIGTGFNGTMTASRAKCYKPNLQIFRQAIETLQLDPAKNLHVACGETTDLIPARQAGFKTAWLRRDRDQHLSHFNPDFTLHGMDALAALVVP